MTGSGSLKPLTTATPGKKGRGVLGSEVEEFDADQMAFIKGRALALRGILGGTDTSGTQTASVGSSSVRPLLFNSLRRRSSI
jgi:hypothetical protein